MDSNALFFIWGKPVGVCLSFFIVLGDYFDLEFFSFFLFCCSFWCSVLLKLPAHSNLNLHYKHWLWDKEQETAVVPSEPLVHWDVRKGAPCHVTLRVTQQELQHLSTGTTSPESPHLQRAYEIFLLEKGLCCYDTMMKVNACGPVFSLVKLLKF